MTNLDSVSQDIKMDVRLLNRQNSPKNNGNSDIDSIPYLHELGIDIINNVQPIKFFDNRAEFIHRWSPYVQGFSASFVQGQFNRYKDFYDDPVVMDPFSGCGTVLVQAKLNGYRSYGTELNPLLHFVANQKINTWEINPERLVTVFEGLPQDTPTKSPDFLKNEEHFLPEVLRNLETIKGGIDSIKEGNDLELIKIKRLLLVAFSSILIDSSNLVRSPCLGYSKTKKVTAETPLILMRAKVDTIASDIRAIQNLFRKKYQNTDSFIYLANAKEFEHIHNYDLVITSPPYMNGLDYVMNYKIEMGWLGFANDHKSLKTYKDEMVVCDNVSKGLIKEFSESADMYTNPWIEEIKSDIQTSIARRGSYRRPDMPNIVHKYFDDMYQVMSKVVRSIKKNGRFILVVGDSLIADVYLPTDLLIAKIGLDLGLEIEKIEKARERRSGQIRSYRLRESIITLKK